MAPKKKKALVPDPVVIPGPVISRFECGIDDWPGLLELMTAEPEEVEPEPEPILYTVTLEGRHGMLDGAVNGVPFRLPRGVEMQVDEPTYHAVKAHIIQER